MVNITCKYIALNQPVVVILYSYSGGEERRQNRYKPFLARSVFLQRVEKIPSVQSFVATSSLPNIWGAVMALGFILISLCGVPQSVMAFINKWIHAVFPAPLGPNTIMPWRTRWVSNNCKGRRITGTLNLHDKTAISSRKIKHSVFLLKYGKLTKIFTHLLGGILQRIASLYLNARRYANTGEYNASNTTTEYPATVKESHLKTIIDSTCILARPFFLAFQQRQSHTKRKAPLLMLRTLVFSSSRKSTERIQRTQPLLQNHILHEQILESTRPRRASQPHRLLPG